MRYAWFDNQVYYEFSPACAEVEMKKRYAPNSGSKVGLKFWMDVEESSCCELCFWFVQSNLMKIRSPKTLRRKLHYNLGGKK